MNDSISVGEGVVGGLQWKGSFVSCPKPLAL